MRCALGIDSGGTKCHAILVKDDGTLLGWARTDDSTMKPEREMGGHGRSYQVILSTILRATLDTDYDELYISSVTSQLPLDFLKSDRPIGIQIHRITEQSAAFIQAGVTQGICALAGTGAFVYGHNKDNMICRLDGIGPHVGDHGGGFQIGYRAIQATARSSWHPRHRTSFANDVLKACCGKQNDPENSSLFAFMAAHHDRSEIARLARFVISASEKGDAVAIGILHDAAKALASTVYDVVDTLQMRSDPCPLIGTGGIIAASDVYWKHFCDVVLEFAPNFTPYRSDLPPVIGVALAALRPMPGIDYEAVRAKLFECTRAFLKKGAASTWHPRRHP